MTAHEIGLPAGKQFSYLACVYGKLHQPGPRPALDGASLAEQCIEQIKSIPNPEQFPPQLLILLVSSAYANEAKVSPLLAAVHEEFRRARPDFVAAQDKAEFPPAPNPRPEDLPLIGCTVNGVVYDEEVHEEGALLICIASRIFKAAVAVGSNARRNPDMAVEELIGALGLALDNGGGLAEGPTPNKDMDLNPLSNRLLLAFVPGLYEQDYPHDYPGPDLHHLLRAKTMGRIALVGGASSTGGIGGTIRPLQFAGREVHADAIVCARIESGVPFCGSIAHGLVPTNDFLHVEKLGADRRTILEFAGERSPAEAVLRIEQQQGGGPVLCGQPYADDDADDRIVVIPPCSQGRPVRLYYKLREHTTLRVYKPGEGTIKKTVADVARDGRRRIHMDNPMVNLLFVCNGRHKYCKRHGQSVADPLRRVTEALEGAPSVGGLFDGEFCLDRLGRNRYANWSVAGLVLGDEMRERSVHDQCFDAMALSGPKLLASHSIGELARVCLNLVVASGYPGAMLSLLFEDSAGDSIIALDAAGTRFRRIIDMTRRGLPGTDILAIVAGKTEAEYIRDAREDPRCESKAVEASGIVSQYVLPLRGSDGRVLGILQIDLGDTSYHEATHPLEKIVMDALGDQIAEALNQFVEREELRIARELDRALVEAMSKEDLIDGVQHYIEKAIASLGANIGHVRLADFEKSKLRLIAGVGRYFEVAMTDERRDVDFSDLSPTCDAFHGRRVIVFNDVVRDPARKKMLARFRDGPVLEALKEHQAYAIVPIKSRDGKSIGTVNITSNEPWFFTATHVKSLEDLGARLGLLVEHIRAAARERFLLASSIQVTGLTQFRDVCEELTSATQRFRIAFRADVASLYLWDPELEAYVLRAHSGWKDSSWGMAARYGERQGWTGNMALESRPRHMPDLAAHKQSAGEDIGRFAKAMFGRLEPGEWRIEGLALPLKIGARRLGILTLHKLVPAGQRTDAPAFTTNDQELLQQAAERMTALVNVADSQFRTLWHDAEQTRRGKVIQALVHAQGRAPHKVLCDGMVRHYQAIRAEVYMCEMSEDSPGQPQWQAGCTRRREDRTPQPMTASGAPDDLVQQAMGSGQVEVHHRQLADNERLDPQKLATEGLVDRACIPLQAEGKTFGILDVRWGVRRSPPSGEPAWHNAESLHDLGASAGTLLWTQRMREDKERAHRQAEASQRAVVAMGAMLFQAGHRLTNLLQNITQLPNLIRDAENDDKREDLIRTLEETIRRTEKTIAPSLDVAQGIANRKRSSEPLGQIVDDAIAEVRPLAVAQGIQLDVDVPQDIWVRVDRKQIRESFSNILNNAIRAMPSGGILSISGHPAEGKEMIEIIFHDTGEGMTPAEVQAALKGSFTRGNRLGVGVLIARLLVQANDGNFELTSRQGAGTQVAIELPVGQEENV